MIHILFEEEELRKEGSYNVRCAMNHGIFGTAEDASHAGLKQRGMRLVFRKVLALHGGTAAKWDSLRRRLVTSAALEPHSFVRRP